ncbi:hypothetical protein TrRE_jg1603 [Triparma retinervis]|uniref:HNH nuclease domain-containing protein n=1 Tax=Triparma retinervis TaxID=2557542 RepID=A0A9W7A269_9STRA|nr:hypothetical protein TrRE_jg1603 [Triparma retinervis]
MMAILFKARHNSPLHPGPPSLCHLVVDHIDNNPRNWSVKNLQFVTLGYNVEKGKLLDKKTKNTTHGLLFGKN